MKNIIKDNCINPNYQNLLESTMRYDTEFRWVYHDNLSEDGESQLVGFSHMFILNGCLLYTSPSPRDRTRSRMPSSA